MSFSRPQSTPPLGLYRYSQTNGWDRSQTQYPESTRSHDQKHSSFPAGTAHHPLHHRYSESTSDENMGVGKRRSNPETQFYPPNVPMSPVNGSNHSYSRRRSGTYSHHVPMRTSRKGALLTHRISDGNLQFSPPGGGGQRPGFQRRPPEGGINVADWVTSSSQFQNLPSHSQTVPDWSSSEQSFTVGSQLSYSASPEEPLNSTPSWGNFSVQSDTNQMSGMSEPFFRHPRHQPHPRPHSTSSTHSRPPSVGSTHSRPPSVGSTHSRPPYVGSTYSHPPSVGSTHSHPPSTSSTHSRPPSTSSAHSRPPSVGSAHSYSNSVLPTFPSERNGRRATSPNIATTRGEAWQLEEEDGLPLEFRGRRTTISQIDEVVASRIHRHYFHTSPMATSPSSPLHSQPRTTTTILPNHTVTGDRPTSPYHDNMGQPPYENMVVSPQRGPYSGYQDPRGVLAAETAKQQSRRIVSNLEHRAASPIPHASLLSPSGSEGGVNEGGTPHPHSHSPNVPIHVGPNAQSVPQTQYHHSYALRNHPSKYLSNHSTTPKNESNLPATESLSDTDLDQLPEKGSPHPKRERSRSKSSPNQKLKSHSSSRLFSIKRKDKSKNSLVTEKKAAESELTKAQVQKRRISSPEGQYTSQLMQKYFPSSEDSPDDQVMACVPEHITIRPKMDP